MLAKTVWFTLAGTILGFVIGFFVASSIDRSQIDQLRANLETAKSSAADANSQPGDLSDEEIRDKIAQADADPANAGFQKNLGLALYRYGSIKEDTRIINDAIRLLERASKLSPSDKDVIVGLGNAWFDLGYANKDNKAFETARTFYESALAKSPTDASVRTDLGMTYFLREPPDDRQATEEFKKALAIDPKNQKALEFIVQSTLRQGNKVAARQYLDRLRDSYPSDSSIGTLAAQIEQSQSAPTK